MLLFTAWVVWHARFALLPFAVGGVLAYALTPIVDRLSHLIPARTRQHDVFRRSVVVLAIYLVLAGAVGGIGVALVPTAVDQAIDFFDDLPVIVEEARVQLTEWADGYRATLPDDLRDQMDEAAENLGARAAEITGAILTNTLGSLTSAVGLIAGFLILPFWLFYALRDRHFIERNFMRAVPAPLQDDVAHVARISDSVLGRYIRAQLLLGLIVGTAVGVSLTLLGVQFSIGLGVWAGITELIPILGPWLGGIAGVIVVLATQPDLLLPVILVYVVVQQLENNLLVPRIQGRAVDIHPAMVIMLIVVFGAVWGLIGVIIAVPVTAITRELFWYVDRRLRGATPDEAFEQSHVGALQRDMPLDAHVDDPANVAHEEEAVRADLTTGGLSEDGPHEEGADRGAVEGDAAGDTRERGQEAREAREAESAGD